MAELTGDQVQARIRPPFFLWMTVVMAIVVFGGFGLSYFGPIATGTLRPVAPVVHFHGLFYFSWMVLLIGQATLINRGNVTLHRSMGMLGIMIGTGLVIFGSIVTILSIKAGMVSDSGLVEFGYPLTWWNVFALANFSVLFALAIRNVRSPEAHKRFVLLATAAFIGVGFIRFIDFFMDLAPDEFPPFWLINVLVDSFVIAVLVYDFKSLGRPHRATITGASLIVGSQLLQPLVAYSVWWVGATHWIGNLAT